MDVRLAYELAREEASQALRALLLEPAGTVKERKRREAALQHAVQRRNMAHLELLKS